MTFNLAVAPLKKFLRTLHLHRRVRRVLKPLPSSFYQNRAHSIAVLAKKPDFCVSQTVRQSDSQTVANTMFHSINIIDSGTKKSGQSCKTPPPTETYPFKGKQPAAADQRSEDINRSTRRVRQTDDMRGGGGHALLNTESTQVLADAANHFALTEVNSEM